MIIIITKNINQNNLTTLFQFLKISYLNAFSYQSDSNNNRRKFCRRSDNLRGTSNHLHKNVVVYNLNEVYVFFHRVRIIIIASHTNVYILEIVQLFDCLQTLRIFCFCYALKSQILNIIHKLYPL